MSNRRYRFRFSPFITVCTAILSALMIKASLWQWDRYLKKTELIRTYEASSQSPPLELPLPEKSLANASAAEYSALHFRKIKVQGTLDLEKQLIVTNRKDISGPGHLLFAPLRIKDSKYAVMLSRGFIPFSDRDPSAWNKYGEKSIEGEFLAVVQPAVQPTRFGPQNPEVGSTHPFAHLWYYEEISKMARQLPYPLLENIYLQQLGGPPSGQFPAQYIRIEVPPSTHFGYTIEWAILALVTFILGIGAQFLPPRKRRPPIAEQLNGNTPNVFALGLLLSLLIFQSESFASNLPDKLPDNVGIKQRLNSLVDLSVRLYDQDGTEHTLRDLTPADRPILLAPVYYRCPHLCGLTLNGMIKAINEIELDLGKDYRVLAVSIDPKEGPDLAAGKATNVYKELKDPAGGESGWRFLTGNEANVKKLMAELGFEYAPDGDEIAHAAGVIVLTPEGRISRYFFGVQFPATELRYSLIEAGQGKIGSLIDHAFLYCFRFDPSKGKYTLVVWNITRVICWAVVVALCALLVTLRIRENER